MGIDLVPKSENALRRYRWREISIVFQGAMNALNPVQRVRDQIAEPIEERLGATASDARMRAGELLELVGIPKARGVGYPARIVGRDAPAGDDRDGPGLRPGRRHRRRADDRARCHGPGADPSVPRGPARQLGLSLILITHDLSVIAETCDRVLIMYAGNVAEEGPVPTSSSGRAIRTRSGCWPPSRISPPTGGPRGHPGFTARPARATAGLPIRAALLVRDGCLLGGGCRQT